MELSDAASLGTSEDEDVGSVSSSILSVCSVVSIVLTAASTVKSVPPAIQIIDSHMHWINFFIQAKMGLWF